MNLKMISLSTLLPLFLSSCLFWGNCEEGKGPVVEKTIEVKNFEELELSGSHTVYLSQGNTQSVKIKAQENLIELLNTQVEGGEWDIHFKKCVKSKEKIEFYVTVPNLNEIAIEGSGEIIGKTPFESDKMELEISGSGEIHVELVNVKELDSEINGSGDLKLSGTTKNHEIEINGSGDVDAYDLQTDNTKVEINGSGDVKINVSYELNVEVNGSGDVYYKGDVKNIHTEVNGSGEINQAN
ncbi:MAG: head GIN domain-containing protein [Vicingaceae bacterium]